jgi:hypothetical protein
MSIQQLALALYSHSTHIHVTSFISIMLVVTTIFENQSHMSICSGSRECGPKVEAVA